MRGQRGLIADHGGALHMIEAVMAALLILSALAGINAISDRPSPDNSDDLRLMSSDLLYIMEQRQNMPGHPGLAQALSSPSAWAEHSPGLVSDLRGYMPAGFRCCLITPYGKAGDCPPDGAAMFVRPFLAYRQETGDIIDCSLIVWRL